MQPHPQGFPVLGKIPSKSCKGMRRERGREEGRLHLALLSQAAGQGREEAPRDCGHPSPRPWRGPRQCWGWEQGRRKVTCFCRMCSAPSHHGILGVGARELLRASPSNGDPKLSPPFPSPPFQPLISPQSQSAAQVELMCC